MSRFHMCMSVRGILSRSNRELKRMLPMFTRDDGSHYATTDQLRDALLDEIAKGHEVLPMGKCDNFDWKDGCKGHEEPAEVEAGIGGKA
ncbi:MAG: hypothetical protein JNG85_14695 [Spirochaetaceae bacterium]|nr:hypothetical protein [Spirochaetaceae bacterium]